MIAASRRAFVAIVLLGMALLAYASLRVGIAAGAADPGLSLAWAPGDARALRRRAEDRLQADRLAAGIAAAKRDALAALSRQPLEPAALRTLGLGLALSGDETHGAALLGLAQRMSRRDAKTQLWFAGTALAAGDVATALHHYDIALRTAPDARPLLYPLLCRALADPSTGGATVRLIAPAPNWTREFVNACADDPRARHALGLALVHAPRVLNAASATAKAKLVAGLAQARDYRTADALYRAITRDRASVPDPALPPFDWSGTSASDVLATPVERGGLYVLAQADRGGTLAMRLLVVPAGMHRLVVDASPLGMMNGLEWRLACDGGPPIATLAGSGGAFATPAGCAAVWLTLTARAGWPARREGVVSRVGVE